MQPQGALTIVLDDTGFGRLGCYGSAIETPNFDVLAADRLRYTKRHTQRFARQPLLRPHRAQPSQERHGRHHGAGPGYPGYSTLMHGMAVVVDQRASDPRQATATWQAIGAIAHALGGTGGDVLGGVSFLLVSWGCSNAP